MRKWRVCGCWVELYAYRAHFGASGLAPRRHQAQLLSRFRIRSIHRSPATFTLRWTPPVNTTLSPHPLGSSAGSWTALPSRPPVATAYRAVYLARPDGHFLRPRCPAATRPRAVWREPGQPTHFDSQLASETGPRQ